MSKDVKCVYIIENIKNKNVYIGSTIHFERRVYEHMYNLRNNNHDNYKLQDDWSLYGEGAFSFSILERVENEDNIKEKEQHWIDLYKIKNEDIYNLYLNAKSPLGYKHSDEFKEYLGESRKGDKNAFYGKYHTEDSKKKMSESHLGKVLTDNQKEALKKGRGKEFFTEETYKKLSEKNRGEGSATAKLTEDSVIEILEHLKNKTMTRKDISSLYSISVAQISRIKNGTRWGHIKDIRSDLYE